MVKTVFVIPTPKSYKEYVKSEPYNTLTSISVEDSDYSYQIDIVSENKKGISEIYNEKLKLYSQIDDISNVVFLHDDVEIHDRFILKKLKKAHEKYNSWFCIHFIFDLCCGTSKLDKCGRRFWPLACIYACIQNY
jgi:hypothetical protein